MSKAEEQVTALEKTADAYSNKIIASIRERKLDTNELHEALPVIIGNAYLRGFADAMKATLKQ